MFCFYKNEIKITFFFQFPKIIDLFNKDGCYLFYSSFLEMEKTKMHCFALLFEQQQSK